MTVLYVAGAMRSGTTALGQALAASPDVLLLGEVRPVLLGLREPLGAPCDCGEAEDRCAFWSGVRDLPDVADAAALATSTRALPTLFAVSLGLRAPTPEIRAVVARLQELERRAGGGVVVDTSKTAAGVLLWRLAGQRVVVVQCVRSPWVVAAKQAASTVRSGLPQASRRASVALWAVHHLAALVAGGLTGVDRVGVGYRAFVADPTGTAERVWRTAGVRSGTVDAAGRFEVGVSHMLVGNPRRSRGGALTVGRRAAAPDPSAVVTEPPVVAPAVA